MTLTSHSASHSASHTTGITSAMPVWLWSKIQLPPGSHICGLLNLSKSPDHKKLTGSFSTEPQSKASRERLLSNPVFYVYQTAWSFLLMSAMVIFHSALCQPNDYFVWPDQRKICNEIRNLQQPQAKKKNKGLKTASWSLLFFTSILLSSTGNPCDYDILWPKYFL